MRGPAIGRADGSRRSRLPERPRCPPPAATCYPPFITEVPRQIGPYEIQREIGRGGMGVVYLARDPRLDRSIAIKMLPERLSSDPAFIQRFAREARLLASLNHPNIATIHSLEESEGRHYLCLEYVDGETLEDQLERGRLSIEAALAVCEQIAEGMEAAHEAGVVHRDLKPSNVKIRPDGNAKILDFGIAKSLRPDRPADDLEATLNADRTVQGAVIGSPGYMSPEQARGLDVDKRADIWAFGCVLYECLTGHLAFPGPTGSDSISRILTAEPDWSRLPPETPDRIRDLLARCLEKDPHDRLRDIGDARIEITFALNRRTTPATGIRPAVSPNNLPTQVTSFVGRKKELSDLKELLRGARLLTLTGSGGCGKTRLSLQLAAESLAGGDFADGTWFIELGALADPALVPQAIAAAMGVKERAGEPLLDTLVTHLRSLSVLLIIDNCEHLLDACAGASNVLLRAAPGLRVIASSRESLGIAGETTYRVPSLSVPPAPAPGVAERSAVEDVLAYEAPQLFLERAKAAKPALNVAGDAAASIVQICRRLDGIPLAIELAAARVRALSVEQIAARLEDSFRLLTGGNRAALPRQQTLRAAIDWSYNMLSEPEKILLRRLSVFAGGWTLEAAEHVCAETAQTSR